MQILLNQAQLCRFQLGTVLNKLSIMSKPKAYIPVQFHIIHI